jgi:hypothetical protein
MGLALVSSRPCHVIQTQRRAAAGGVDSAQTRSVFSPGFVDTTVAHSEPPPMRTGRVAKVCDRGTAELRRTRLAPARQHEFTRAIRRGANDRCRVMSVWVAKPSSSSVVKRRIDASRVKWRIKPISRWDGRPPGTKGSISAW